MALCIKEPVHLRDARSFFDSSANHRNCLADISIWHKVVKITEKNLRRLGFLRFFQLFLKKPGLTRILQGAIIKIKTLI